MTEEVEDAVLREISSHGDIPDTGCFASKHNFDHQKVAGVALSLESIGFILKKVSQGSRPGSTTKIRCWLYTECGSLPHRTSSTAKTF